MVKEKKRVNILVASSKYPPEYSGSGLRAHRTYKRFSSKFGFNYKVLCGSIVFNQTGQYMFEGVWVYRIACKLFRNISNDNSSFIKKIVKKFKNGVNYISEAIPTWIFLFKYGSEFSLIHIFGYNFVTAAALTYAKITKKPLIIEICNEIRGLGQYEPFLLKAIFGKGIPLNSKVICISERLKNICINSGSSVEIWCRPNPIDNSKFFVDRKNKSICRRKNKLFSDQDIVLLNIGKFFPLKNQIFLLDVLKKLPEEFKLVLAGPLVDSGPNLKRDNIYFDKLIKKVKDYGMEHRVKVEKRFVDNVDEYMKASDVYLLPSKIEACATPMLEALACGLPVVANRIEGVTDSWIRDGINGYLASLKVDSFIDKILKTTRLDKDKIDRSAEEIRRIVSNDVIESEYARLIQGQIKSSN